MSAPRKAALVLVVLAVLAAPAALWGARASGVFSSAATTRMGTYTEILSLIEEKYAAETDTKKVVYASINGMLDTLDPHSNFLDDDIYREMREEQRGVFFGLGIVIGKRGRYQPLRVVAPIADTPADRLGIRGGDVISHIKDVRAAVDTDTIDLTVQEAVRYLKGPKGTEVEITVERVGLDKPMVFKIQRDAIRTPAVNQAFMVRPGIGYVHVANFTETTASELDAALEKLKGEGAQKLVLDLTGNPGGLLEQAISVSSRFLDPGELVVYTEGRNGAARQDYPALRDVQKVDWPIVVLVDRESASASEIVSGALQDHDRALVLGETTFGKGLVQSVYPLSENCGLALTTQKYYTPVGRSIQRPFAIEEEYFFANRERDAIPKPKSDAPSYRTDTGRTVYGGGGITPDIPVTVPDPAEVLVQLTRVSAITRYITSLDMATQKRLEGDPAALLTEFTAWTGKELQGVKASDLAAAKDDVVMLLRAELALVKGGMAARERVLLERNPVLLKALASFDEAAKLVTKKHEASPKRAAVR